MGLHDDISQKDASSNYLEDVDHWQYGTPLYETMHRVMSILEITKLSRPRFCSASFIDAADGQTLEEVMQMVVRDPAMPIVLISAEEDLNEVINKNPLISAVLKYPNVRIMCQRFSQSQDVKKGRFSGLSIPSCFRPLRCVDVSDLNSLMLSMGTENDVFAMPKTESFGEDHSKFAERLRGVIRHDLAHALNGENGYDVGNLIGRARRELGLGGTYEEVRDLVMTKGPSIEIKSHFPLNVLAVDWDGTLFKDGKFDVEAFDKYKKIAETESLPFMIWTGGANINGVYDLLEKSGRKAHVCSKYDCKGFRVKSAYDDEDLSELRAKYGIDAESFQRV